MQLSDGDRLGPYEITSLIGQGGMGEVYKGTDTRLGRAVAIKVSAREFGDRFEREARIISSLNHPNICTLYDVGPNYLVLELVEGQTLADLLARGPLPLDKALLYAIQIVDALAAAHARGVIHRDLKPGNIIVTKNGIKVLDFGLAKLANERVGQAASLATMTEPITGAGAVLGTLHYMSPEQVEGKPADERSDIFAFGVVLYEMIAGQRPFTGDSSASILAAVLRDPPPSLAQRQPLTPRALERVVRKCLEKNPDERWQSARDLKPTLELIDLDAPPAVGSGSSSSAQVPLALPPARRRRLWAGVAAVAIVAAAGLAWTVSSRPDPVARVTRFEVALPSDVQVVANDFYVRVSPDGLKLAFITTGENGGIWVRDLESVQARLLPGTAGAVAPFWSPDSRSLAFARGNRLMRVEIQGGPPQVLCESATPVGSGVWTERGEIVFGGRGLGVLQRVSAAGGVPTPVTALAERETAHALPSLLPDGRQFLYLRVGTGFRGLFVGSLDTRPEEQSLRQVAPAEFGATFAKTGDAAGGVLFYVRDGTLMAQPFDVQATALTGEPVPIVQEIGTGLSHAHFSVTPDGLMAYRTGSGSVVQLAWFDRKGLVVEKVGAPGEIGAISLSPDEKQLAVFRSDAGSVLAGDIWLLDLARNVETRFTTGQRVAVYPDLGAIWSPDGRQLAYGTDTGVHVKDAGGAAEATLVMESAGPASARVTDWTSDGRFLIVSLGAASGNVDVVALAAAGGDAVPVVATPVPEGLARLSPDNRWIAYSSAVSGRNEVYVRPFAPPGAVPAPAGPVIQISRNGGAAPKWRADGRELFFRAPNNELMSVAIETSSTTFRPTAPTSLGLSVEAPAQWAPSKGGDRFLLKSPDRGVQTPITVVTNWEATFRR